MELNYLMNYKQTADGLTKNNLINVSNDFKLINNLQAIVAYLCKICNCVKHAG